MIELLLTRARVLGGVFATADATGLGVGSHELCGLVRAGDVVRVAPRAYVLADQLQLARSPEARHRLHTLAVVRSFGGRVAASHHSAAALHGLPFWRVDARALHVCRLSGRSSRVRGPLHIHEATCDDEIRHARSLDALTTTAAAAAVGTAMVDGIEAGVVAMDAALHRDLATRLQLELAVQRRSLTSGVTRAREALQLADGRAESPGESRTRLVLRHLPPGVTVEPQAVITDGTGAFVARSDFLVGRRVVVEFDGRSKYGMDGRPEDQLWAEKLREDRIRALGLGVVRLTWTELDDPARVVRTVVAALAKSHTA